MKQEDDPGESCLWNFIALALLGFMLYGLGAWLVSLWYFFASPGWPHELLVMIEGVFVCASGVFVLFGLSLVWEWFFPPAAGGGDEDYY